MGVTQSWATNQSSSVSSTVTQLSGAPIPTMTAVTSAEWIPRIRTSPWRRGHKSAIEFLKKSAGKGDKPFCLFVSLVNPHDVYI
jgi:hypothetical protein